MSGDADKEEAERDELLIRGDFRVTRFAAKQVGAGVAADGNHFGVAPIGDPAVRALDVTPHLRRKAVKAVNCRARQLKRRFLFRYAVLRAQYFLLKAHHFCLLGLGQLYGNAEKGLVKSSHDASPYLK